VRARCLRSDADERRDAFRYGRKASAVRCSAGQSRCRRLLHHRQAFGKDFELAVEVLRADPQESSRRHRPTVGTSIRKPRRVRRQRAPGVSEARVLKAQRLLTAAVPTWGVAGAGSDLVGGIPGSAGIGLTAGHREIPWFGHFAIAPYRVHAQHLTVHRTA
jgi:hypothetical protein